MKANILLNFLIPFEVFRFYVSTASPCSSIWCFCFFITSPAILDSKTRFHFT